MPPAVDLPRLLTDARARTLSLVEGLSAEQLLGPRLPIVNPLLWEIGHVAWFQEKWLLRHLRGEPPVLAEADRLYDSAAVPHDSRWSLPLPPLPRTLEYMGQVLDRVRDRLRQAPRQEDFYFAHLALFHEDMHDEAFTYTRQTLGYPPPPGAGPRPDEAASGEEAVLNEDAFVPGGTFVLGSTPDAPFVFDNEKWAHEVRVEPFRIARAKVTNTQFARFVDDEGYRRRELWSEAGWEWRASVNARQPVYWVRTSDGGWSWRHYDRVEPLRPQAPVLHVNWHEAQAYCRWAGRRLPTEVEWEAAASAEPGPGGRTLGPGKRRHPWGDEPPNPGRALLDAGSGGHVPAHALPAGDSAFGCRQLVGSAWEWTASDFGPYPGFAPDPYQEYSQPWFGGTHKVLRGGAFATRSRLVHNTYRNFYTPDRRDVLAGFRTCGL